MSNDRGFGVAVTTSHQISRWQEGADAARAGKEPDDCPYPRWTYHFVTWMNGWSVAMHQLTKEREDNEWKQLLL